MSERPPLSTLHTDLNSTLRTSQHRASSYFFHEHSTQSTSLEVEFRWKRNRLLGAFSSVLNSLAVATVFLKAYSTGVIYSEAKAVGDLAVPNRLMTHLSQYFKLDLRIETERVKCRSRGCDGFSSAPRNKARRNLFLLKVCPCIHLKALPTNEFMVAIENGFHCSFFAADATWKNIYVQLSPTGYLLLQRGSTVQLRTHLSCLQTFLFVPITLFQDSQRDAICKFSSIIRHYSFDNGMDHIISSSSPQFFRVICWKSGLLRMHGGMSNSPIQYLFLMNRIFQAVVSATISTISPSLIAPNPVWSRLPQQKTAPLRAYMPRYSGEQQMASSILPRTDAIQDRSLLSLSLADHK